MAEPVNTGAAGASTTPKRKRSEPREISPMLQMALGLVMGRSAEAREEMVTLVCDTLGAYPRFWRSRDEEDEEPNQALCVVKIQPRNGNPVATYQIAAWDEETRIWKWHEQAIADVVAWAILPV
jgi:hypothetical protein